MPIIEIPNVGDVEFPDSMSPDELNKAAAMVYRNQGAQRTALDREIQATGTPLAGPDRGNALPPPSAEMQAMQRTSAQAAGEIGKPRFDADYEQQLRDLGLTQADMDQADAYREAALAERLRSEWRAAPDPTVRQQIERNPLFRKFFGPTALEREAGVGQRGSPGEIAGTLMEAASTMPPVLANPIRSATDLAINQIPNETARGVARGGRELALSIPGIMATAQVLPSSAAVLAAFGGEAAWHLPEQRAEFEAAKANGDNERAAEIATTAFGNGALLVGGAALGAGFDAANVRSMRRMADAGPARLLPNPDLVARNLAAPGTLRPTEQRAMASPLEGRPAPAEVFIERTPIRNPAGEVVDVVATPKPRIRELVFEDPQLIEPVTRFVKPDVEGGKLPERPQGFQRTAEDFIEARPQELQVDRLQGAGERAPEPATLNQLPAPKNLERPSRTIEETKAPAAETAAGERSKAAPEIAAPATPAPEPVKAVESSKSKVESSEAVPTGKESLPVRQKPAKGTKTPAQMTPPEINRRLDRLSKESEQITDQFIESGRGMERPTDYRNKTDELSVRANRVSDEIMALRSEIDARYGPGAPSRMPSGKGFGPREKPGLISNTKAEAWADRTIAESKGRVNTGIDPELMAAYLTKGVAHLERGTREFAAWARKMIAEHGDAVRPHLRTLFEQSQRTLQQLTADGRKMRSVSKRGAESDQLPDQARAQIGVDPASFYATQKPKVIEQMVAQMTNNELRQPLDLKKQGNAQDYVLRQLELSRRLMADKTTFEEGYAMFQALSQQGTSFGQLLNQLKALVNQTPDGLLNVINRRLADSSAPPLTPEQRVQLRVLAGKNLQDISAWRSAEEAWAANPTRANLRRVIDAQAQAEASGRLFNERTQRIVPRGFWDTATAMMLGNKLSILSQERNVVANVALMPLRMASRLPAATIDMIDAMIRNKPREVTTSLRGVAGTLQGAAGALPEAGRTMLRGTVSEGLGKGEGTVNLRPLVALREILSGELLRNKPLASKLALMAEASPPAYFAAGMLRGLAALDLPSRQAAFGRLIGEQLKLDYMNARSVARALERRGNLTPEEQATLAQLRTVPKPSVQVIRDAVRAPELFVKPEALARIRQEALGAVFQDKNAFTRAVLGIEKVAPPPVRFALRAVVPFVSTPVNIIGKMFAFSPAGFLTHVARHALKGDSRAAKLAAGDAIVGSLLWTAGLYLWDKGVISPPLDDADEQQKMRVLQGDLMPPNHINVSGLNRLFDGQDPAWRPGDKTVDFTYYGSLAGAQLQIIAAIKRQQEKNPAPETQADAVAQWIGGAVQGAGGYMVNQTFMQGTRDLLDAFRSERKFDEFLARYSMSIADTALPRQMESINKATREFQREVKDDAPDKRLHNQLVNRLGVFTTKDDALPFKRDVWGQPLRETPAGSNPWIYQLFDVGRGRVIPDDPLKLEVYNLARRTADPRAIPTPPDASVTMLGTTYKLTPAQQSALQEQVGQTRLRLAQTVMTPRFHSLSDDQKLTVLERAWSLGAQFGTMRWWIQNSDQLTEKPKPMGRR